MKTRTQPRRKTRLRHRRGKLAGQTVESVEPDGRIRLPRQPLQFRCHRPLGLPHAINMAQWVMRTTVDIPDALYRRLKSRAAREGSSTRALILKGVKDVLKAERRKAGVAVSLPIVRSSRPGTVALDNAAIYDLAFP